MKWWHMSEGDAFLCVRDVGIDGKVGSAGLLNVLACEKAANRIVRKGDHKSASDHQPVANIQEYGVVCESRIILNDKVIVPKNNCFS
jgi:hypothetical protein